MQYNFHINEFEGPLDLLLHLVKESKMDIYEIEISRLTEEYLKFIQEMENLNIDIASEYLVMAAELLHLKSKTLINRKDEEDIEDEFRMTSEEDLKAKLIAYQKYKDISDNFKKLEAQRSEIYTKIPENIHEYLEEDISYNNELNVQDLLNAFLSFQEREDLKKPQNTKITRREFSVEKRIDNIRSLLKTKKTLKFKELFDIMSRDYLIVTFLSILEMSKNNEIDIKQKKNFGEIIIEGKETK